jgi:hypothetical protein
MRDRIANGTFEGRVYEIEVDVNYSEPQQLIMEVGTQVMLSAQLTSDTAAISRAFTSMIITASIGFCIFRLDSSSC